MSESSLSSPPPPDLVGAGPTVDPAPAAATDATTVVVPPSSSASSLLSSVSDEPQPGPALEADEKEAEYDASLGVSEVGRLMDEQQETEDRQRIEREEGRQAATEEDERAHTQPSVEPAVAPSSTVLVPASQDEPDPTVVGGPDAESAAATAVEQAISAQDEEIKVAEELASEPRPPVDQATSGQPSAIVTIEPVSVPSPVRRSPSPRPSSRNAVASSSKLASPPPPPSPPPSRAATVAFARDEFDDLLDLLDGDDDFSAMDVDHLAPSSTIPHPADTSRDADDDDEVLPSSQPDERPAAALLPRSSQTNGDGQDRPMSSPPSDFMSRGFTTGGDRKAPVKPIAEDALRREREKMDRDGEDEDREQGGETLSAKRRRLNTPAAMSRSGSPFDRPGVTSKRLPPPAFGLSAPPARLAQVPQGDDQDPFSNRFSRPPSRAPSPMPLTPAFESFKTASGKPFAAPSRAKLLAAAKILDEDLDKIMGDATEEIFASQPRPANFGPPIPAVAALPAQPSRVDSPAMWDGARTPFAVIHSENGGQADTPSRPSIKSDKVAYSMSVAQTEARPPPPTLSLKPLHPSVASSTNANGSSSTPLRPAAFRAPSSVIRPVPSPFRPPATPTNAHASTSSTPLRAPMQPPRQSTPATSTPVALRRVGVGLGMTPRSKGAKKRPAFTTPFKKGHEGGVGTLFEHSGGNGKEREIIPSSASKPKTPKVKKEYRKVFDLTRPEKRVSMVNAFIKPEFYSPDELADMDIPEEIWRIDATNAAYYGFLDTTSTDANAPNKGHADALIELTAAGCEGLTAAWVENHWALILWKLASLVRSKPSLFGEEKFSWEEMIRQLKYRYEREHNLGHRSAVQRIQEQDSPASLSSVLVVSSIAFQPAPPPDIGARDAPPAGTMLACLELTDGWYRIQATTDVVLSRAAQRGKLKVGCKIGLSGVRLEAKEGGTPVLRALSSSSLTLTANTTSLLPWDTKLGFHPRPFIACLASLSADGGLVPVMDIVVEKCFPLAYVDGYDQPPPGLGGQPSTQQQQPVMRGPQISRSEADEAKEVVKWEKAAHTERRAIRTEKEKELETLAGLTDRVERAAMSAPRSAPNDDTASPEETYDDLENADDKTAFLKSLPLSSLPPLARYMKDLYAQQIQTMAQTIEDEVVSRCPPRNVRSMRVLKIRDFRTTLPSSSTRTAQLTLWDAAAMSGEEGDGLEAGKRYLVTNLMPAQRGSWAMPGARGEGDKPGGGGEIYLSTRRDSRWERKY